MDRAYLRDPRKGGAGCWEPEGNSRRDSSDPACRLVGLVALGGPWTAVQVASKVWEEPSCGAPPPSPLAFLRAWALQRQCLGREVGG